MNDSTLSRAFAQALPVAAAVSRVPALLGEAALSPRGLALGFFGVALALTTVGWLRPTLSRDIAAVHLPMRFETAAGPPPEAILHGPRRVSWDSVGVCLLAFLGLVTAAVLLRPQLLGKAAGVLLAVAIAGNTAVALNHPALIELLDYEYEQRQQMARMLSATDDDVMLSGTNSRVGLRGLPASEDQRGDPIRGWLYLLYGRWLVLWASLGTVFAGAGSLRRRFGSLVAWGFLGLALSIGVCRQRLLAEYHWLRAQQWEAQGRLDDARQAVATAVALFPEFERLERTWLFCGKLDHRAHRASSQAVFYQAYQLARDKEAARGITLLQDLPWTIPGIRDARAGLTASPSGFSLSITADGGRPGTLGFAEDPPASFGPVTRSYRIVRSREPRQAIALLESLITDAKSTDPAVRAQLARLWTDLGLALYWKDCATPDSRPQADHFRPRMHLMEASSHWHRASAIDAAARDSVFYQGVVQSRIDRGSPVLLECSFAAALRDLGDQVLHAEILNTIGDSYFDAGMVSDARRRFARSYDVFCLPKFINFRAQARLGGL